MSRHALYPPGLLALLLLLGLAPLGASAGADALQARTGLKLVFEIRDLIHRNYVDTVDSVMVIDAALDSKVDRVLMLSTDKAVNPVNLYGATKLAAEKLMVQSNAYAGGMKTRFSCVRYGNVVGSRGSVVPLFIKQREVGEVTLTDERMTRFWISLDQGVDFVIRCIEEMQGGEVFVPKIPSMKMVELAEAIAPNARVRVIGIRPGEKLHEVLISTDEARTTVELADMYVVQPAAALWFGHHWSDEGERLPDGFHYASDNNSVWLTLEEIQKMVASKTLDSEEGLV